MHVSYHNDEVKGVCYDYVKIWFLIKKPYCEYDKHISIISQLTPYFTYTPS